jgi:hypothetical protein
MPSYSDNASSSSSAKKDPPSFGNPFGDFDFSAKKEEEAPAAPAPSAAPVVDKAAEEAAKRAEKEADAKRKEEEKAAKQLAKEAEKKEAFEKDAAKEAEKNAAAEKKATEEAAAAAKKAEKEARRLAEKEKQRLAVERAAKEALPVAPAPVRAILWVKHNYYYYLYIRICVRFSCSIHTYILLLFLCPKTRLHSTIQVETPAAVKIPEFKAPDVKIPDFKAPDMPAFKAPDMPAFKAPDMPAFKAPDIKMPDVSMPSFSMPKVDMPKFDMPKIDVPAAGVVAAPKSSSSSSFDVPKVPSFSAPSFGGSSASSPTKVQVSSFDDDGLDSQEVRDERAKEAKTKYRDADAAARVSDCNIYGVTAHEGLMAVSLGISTMCVCLFLIRVSPKFRKLKIRLRNYEVWRMRKRRLQGKRRMKHARLVLVANYCVFDHSALDTSSKDFDGIGLEDIQSIRYSSHTIPTPISGRDPC